MKSNYFFKKLCLVIAAMAMGISVNAATTYFVSDGGNDDNIGSSQEQAFKTFRKACDVATTGDIICIVGTVKVLEEAIPKFAGLTFVGLGGSNAILDGGGNKSAIMTISDEVEGIGEKSYDYLFTNLTIQNAYRKETGGGGAINIDANVKVRFSNCTFNKNRTDCKHGINYERDLEDSHDLWWNSDDQWNGGAIRMNGKGDGEIEIYNCTFGGTDKNDGNYAFRGGALDIVNVNAVTIEHTKFIKNRTVVNMSGTRDDKAVGGAIATNACNTIIINHCVFADNSTFSGPTVGGGGPDGAAGGAMYLAPVNGGKVTVSNSSIVNNNTLQHGGAIAAKGTNINYTFINCTFAENLCANAGSVIYAPFSGANAELNLINCTISDNYGKGDLYCGAAIMIMEPKKSFKVYNSIIEGNLALNNSGSPHNADISYMYENAIIESVEIKNSYIGTYQSSTFLDDNTIINNSQYGYYWADDDFAEYSQSGISTGDVIIKKDGYAYFPLRKDSPAYPAIDGGSFALLNEFGEKNDLFGTERGNPKCSIGSVEGILEGDDSPVVVVKSDCENGLLSNEVCELIPDGIYNVAPDGAVAVAYYTLLGVKLDKEPASGLFIVKYSNGAILKVLK